MTGSLNGTTTHRRVRVYAVENVETLQQHLDHARASEADWAQKRQQLEAELAELLRVKVCSRSTLHGTQACYTVSQGKSLIVISAKPSRVMVVVVRQADSAKVELAERTKGAERSASASEQHRTEPLRGPLAARARYKKKRSSAGAASTAPQPGEGQAYPSARGSASAAAAPPMLAPVRAPSSVALVTGMLDPSSSANTQSGGGNPGLAPKPIFVVADCTGALLLVRMSHAASRCASERHHACSTTHVLRLIVTVCLQVRALRTRAAPR